MKRTITAGRAAHVCGNDLSFGRRAAAVHCAVSVQDEHEQHISDVEIFKHRSLARIRAVVAGFPPPHIERVIANQGDERDQRDAKKRQEE